MKDQSFDKTPEEESNPLKAKKVIDEGHLVSEYLSLLLSIVFIPFFLVLFIMHGTNYFSLKESSKGVIEHYHRITKSIYQNIVMFSSLFIYMLILKDPADQPNIVVSLLFLVSFIALITQAVKGLKMLARHEI